MEKQKLKKERNSNFELMRIVSMLFIILWHVIIHGHMIENCQRESIKILLQVLQFIIIVHVDSFIVLSGYFQSKSTFKLSKFFKLIINVIFYSICILIYGIKVGIVTDYNIVYFIENVLPSSISNYWFMRAYLLLYVLSNFFNRLIDNMKQNEFKTMIYFLFFIFSILPFLTGDKFFATNNSAICYFSLLYFIGAYLRRYPLKKSYHFAKQSDNGYKITIIMIFILMIFLNYSCCLFADRINNTGNVFNMVAGRINSMRLNYANPFVIIQTICYFELFGTLNIKNKIVNYLSSLCFGIYLFHDNAYIRQVIYVFFKIDNGRFTSYKIVIYMFLITILIFIIGIIIEMIRRLIFKTILKLKFTKMIVNKIEKFSQSFIYNINW